MQIRRTRHEMYKFIDADYYGFRDEEDGMLLPVEAEAQKDMQAEVSLILRHCLSCGYGQSPNLRRRSANRCCPKLNWNVTSVPRRTPPSPAA